MYENKGRSFCVLRLPSKDGALATTTAFLVTSPIVINVPTRGLLAVETMHAIVQWLANLNIKRNMTSMFVNKKHRYMNLDFSSKICNCLDLFSTPMALKPAQAKYAMTAFSSKWKR